MKTVMVRLLLEVEDDASDKHIAGKLQRAVSDLPSGRKWIAIDHPQQDAAQKLWASIKADKDPDRPGVPALSGKRRL